MPPELAVKLLQHPIGIGAMEYMALHFDMFDLNVVIAINFLAAKNGTILAKHIELALMAKMLRSMMRNPWTQRMPLRISQLKPTEEEVGPPRSPRAVELRVKKSLSEMQLELLLNHG